MGVFIFLILGVVSACYFWVKNRYSYWSDRGFASPKPKFPLGSMTGVGSKVTSAEAMDVIYKKYKGKTPVVGVFMMFQPTILPIDPELFKNILVRDFASFHDRGFYYNKEDDPLSAKYEKLNAIHHFLSIFYLILSVLSLACCRLKAKSGETDALSCHRFLLPER